MVYMISVDLTCDAMTSPASVNATVVVTDANGVQLPTGYNGYTAADTVDPDKMLKSVLTLAIGQWNASMMPQNIDTSTDEVYVLLGGASMAPVRFFSVG